MTKYTRTIGTNRGKQRLWLECLILSANGFAHGAPWRLEVQKAGTGACIDLVADPEGTRKVAGTAQRPIIDINSKNALESFACGDTVTITVISPGWLRVEG